MPEEEEDVAASALGETIMGFFFGVSFGEVVTTGASGSIASAVGSKVTNLARIMLSKCCLAS